MIDSEICTPHIFRELLLYVYANSTIETMLLNPRDSVMVPS